MIQPAIFSFLLHQLSYLMGTSCPWTSFPSSSLIGQGSRNQSPPGTLNASPCPSPQVSQCLPQVIPRLAPPWGLSALLTPSQCSCPFLTWLCLEFITLLELNIPQMALPPPPEEVQPSARNLTPPFSTSTYLHLHTLGWSERRNVPCLPSGQVLPWVLSPVTPILQELAHTRAHKYMSD